MPAPTLAPTTDLRISLAGIARLAAVKRPVVTTWRSRFATGDTAFPAPVGTEAGIVLFDAVEVAHWLVDTGHGKNPHAVEDAALHATSAVIDLDFDALTAMLALRAAHGGPFADLDADDLVDFADEVDPDDDCLLREVDRLGDGLAAAARRVDALVDAAYTPTAAFEQVIADHIRGSREFSRVVLAPEASALVSEIAIELALTNELADAGAPCFVDPTGVGGDRLVDLAGRLDELADVAIVSADSDAGAARLLRRRLLALGVARTGVKVGTAGDFEVMGPVVHVAQYPTAEAPEATPLEILTAIDQIVLQMSDAQRGVVLAPASVLVDGGLDRATAQVRSGLLRAGRVRAIVALPAGLVVAQPRQRLALWVLGPAHAAVSIADRWTLVGDIGDRDLSPATRADLVGDLAASMGEVATVRAHAFGSSRLVPTSKLLARTESLTDERTPVAHAPREQVPAGARDVPALLDELLLALGESAPASARRLSAAESPAYLQPAALGRLVDERHLRCLSGARMGAADLTTDSGFTVIGAAELEGASMPGDRRIDRMLLAARYPKARLTEPGDVVFTTSPHPRAWVDSAGASVVVAPARVLRIDARDPAGLVPEVLAADINGQPERASDWQSWRARRVVNGRGDDLVSVLRDIRSVREETQRRLDDLARLESLVTAGFTAGTLTAPERND
ncbi:hypothetical protein [Agromyces humatus]|uniref:DNA methylase adenine-specific domain-containing protein n=1 Tax=Agromyces humatus TaxID=279573 RepID=A0ABN2KYE0_9MICO|nr:hypothetical protein [Agromyces humatus]